MIRLIAGLGNPGSKYKETRHNAGFLFADCFATAMHSSWQEKKSFKALIAPLSGGDGALLKPLTFMNLSGDAVGAYARYYKIAPDEILVAHDELDLDAGTVRLKTGGGHGGHNGLRDIISKLGSRDFHRLRIGIGHPGSSAQVLNYVLGKPSPDDRISIISAVERTVDFATELLNGDFQPIMNQLHSKA